MEHNYNTCFKVFDDSPNVGSFRVDICSSFFSLRTHHIFLGFFLFCFLFLGGAVISSNFRLYPGHSECFVSTLNPVTPSVENVKFFSFLSRHPGWVHTASSDLPTVGGDSSVCSASRGFRLPPWLCPTPVLCGFI